MDRLRENSEDVRWEMGETENRNSHKNVMRNLGSDLNQLKCVLCRCLI